MARIKVMSIFGTRPETSKMAPIIKELENCEHIQSIVCVTAQHRQMLDQTLEVFGIKPDYDLNIMSSGQTLTDIATRAMIGLKEVFEKEKPDLVLVHGDTSTTFASALSAFYAGIKVGHVEAGLRTYNKLEPFPEEMNRLLTTALADFYFSPTELAKQNLLKESINEEKIFVTGNTAVDCIKSTVNAEYKFSMDVLNNLDFLNKKVILMTAHRRENIGQPLVEICNAMLKIVEGNEELQLVYAVHLNPLVQETARKILGNHDRILLTDPIDMLDMHNIMNRSYLIVSDSGGLQEEAPGVHKPVVVLRNVTERPEGLEAGTLKLAGTDENVIIKTINEILLDKTIYNQMATAKNPYGDGFAAKRIVDCILYNFGIIKNRPKDFV